jgi:hypothetical protein
MIVRVLGTAVVFAAAASVVLAPSMARAQSQMPDMKQMSGTPRPVDDLPDRTVAVRVIRGELSNNIANQTVELKVGEKTETGKTDETGHVQFGDLAAGAAAKAVTVVDGERLESQEFPVPARGGVRLMLVATDKSKAAAGPVSAEPIPGQVVLGGQSRIVVEPGDESLTVYYLLEISNAARSPVKPTSLFTFDMPTGAVGTSLMEGSSPSASVNGTRVRVQGPFPPGATLVQVACELPVSGSSLEFTQRFPANLEQLAIIVKKVGETTLSSPQLASQQDMTGESQAYIAGTGGAVAAGQPITLAIAGLPHHSAAPRWTALIAAGLIVLLGIWGASRKEDPAVRAAERKRLLARRGKLFAELVRLENDHRQGRGDQSHYAGRREELVAALEHVYGALDVDDAGPGPEKRPGLAA